MPSLNQSIQFTSMVITQTGRQCSLKNNNQLHFKLLLARKMFSLFLLTPIACFQSRDCDDALRGRDTKWLSGSKNGDYVYGGNRIVGI